MSCRTGRAEPSARIDPYVRVTTARWRRREADAIAIQRRQNEINVGYKAASGQKQIAAVKWLLYWQGVIDHVDCVQREGLTPAQVGQLHPRQIATPRTSITRPSSVDRSVGHTSLLPIPVIGAAH